MEENKKFCKFCGEKIDKDCVVCPKCGRQLELIKEDEKKELSDAKEDHKDNIVEKPKFYTQAWFMWVMLIVFAPIGIFLMWKFHPEMKKNLKIILTVVFAIFFIIIYLSNGSDTESPSSDYGTNNYQKDKKVAVEVVDFSSMTKAEIEIWCNENKINCNFKDEYSDSVEKGQFINQSVESTKTIYQGERITISYSLGKAPTKAQENALKSAQSYLRFSAFSRKGLIEQLEYEGYSHDEAVYGVDNVGADWNEQAVKSAESYLKHSAFSRKGLIEQLEYEGFTHEQAVYGVDQNGL